MKNDWLAAARYADDHDKYAQSHDRAPLVPTYKTEAEPTRSRANTYTVSAVLVFKVLRATVLITFCACSHAVTFHEDAPITIIGPPVSAVPAVVNHDVIVIRANIHFGADASLSPDSFAVLDQVALLSMRNPGIKTIVVEKVELTPARANALLAYLVQHGVESDIAIESAGR